MQKEFKQVLVEKWTQPSGSFDMLYFIDGVPVTEKEFELQQFKDLLVRSASIISFRKLTVAEVIEKYGNVLSPEQIESLNNPNYEGEDIGID